MGKLLIIVGIILVIAGIFIHFNLKVPWMGRLPGDITIKREGFSLYIPVVTSLLLSGLLTLILYILSKLR